MHVVALFSRYGILTAFSSILHMYVLYRPYCVVVHTVLYLLYCTYVRTVPLYATGIRTVLFSIPFVHSNLCPVPCTVRSWFILISHDLTAILTCISLLLNPRYVQYSSLPYTPAGGSKMADAPAARRALTVDWERWGRVVVEQQSGGEGASYEGCGRRGRHGLAAEVHLEEAVAAVVVVGGRGGGRARGASSGAATVASVVLAREGKSEGARRVVAPDLRWHRQ